MSDLYDRRRCIRAIRQPSSSAANGLALNLRLPPRQRHQRPTAAMAE